MTAPAPHAARLAAVEAGFRSLPERYLGAEPGFDATWRIVLGDVGHTWEVRCTTHGARARRGATNRRPDVVIGTDADTWMALRRGELSGIEAFGRRLLYARGNLDLAVAFEGMFRLESGRKPLLRIHEVRLPGRRISTLTMGSGPDVLLIHGLGGAKSSFFDAAAALARSYRVHALDLPGFGSSS
ncbi:MAG TPA: alpha/beta fold hydrolase, partial [Solirubrobacteraceae bacterium]|nr:alpha/beta fold hydrolase [Solirubrobacteraceae bacterium]